MNVLPFADQIFGGGVKLRGSLDKNVVTVVANLLAGASLFAYGGIKSVPTNDSRDGGILESRFSEVIEYRELGSC